MSKHDELCYQSVDGRWWVNCNCEEIAKAKLAEQQRIVKLLEENWVEPMDWLSVIALIKGENK